jgi:hypothetical protein
MHILTIWKHHLAERVAGPNGDLPCGRGTLRNEGQLTAGNLRMPIKYRLHGASTHTSRVWLPVTEFFP